PSNPTPEIQRGLAATGARALIVAPAAKKAVAGLNRDELPELEFLIASSGVDIEGALLLDDVLQSEPAPIAARDDDDVAVLMFPSGTAGSPKAAMLSHGNLRSNLEQIQQHPGRTQEASDCTLGVLPLFHIFGLNVALGLTLYTGARIVLIE